MALPYKIVTMSVGWDDTYSNTLHFDTREKQYEYFNIPTVFDNAVEVNFPVGSLVNATVTYRGVDDIQQLMNDNYCIIQNNGVSLETPQYYFYFIKQTNYLSSNQVSLSLELDVIQTYIIDTNFSECLIERCMIDRFIPDGADFKFNNGVDSPLLNSEGMDLPKRLINRSEIEYECGNTEANTLMNKVSWAYIYLDTSVNFTCPNGTVSHLIIDEITLPYYCIVAPVTHAGLLDIKLRTYTGASTTYPNQTTTVNWTLDDTLKSLEALGLTPNIINLKISSTPPFIYNQFYGSIVSGNTLYMDVLMDKPFNENLPNMQGFRLTSGSVNYYFAGFTYYTGGLYSNIEIDYNKTLTKDEIINSNYYDIEPKSYCSNVLNLKLRDETGNGFEYDIQKLNTNTLKLRVIESFTCDINKSAIQILNSGLEDSVYYDSYLGLNGLISSVDNSIPYTENQLDTFMSNNKNFYSIAASQDRTNFISTAANALGGIASGNTAAGIAQGISGAASAYNTIVKRNFTIDNMKSAPEQVNNIAGNALFNTLVNSVETSYYPGGIGKLRRYVEIYSAVDQDKLKFIDYLHEYGYSYALISQPKDWVNKREHFSYIEAKLESITSDKKLSNQVRDKFRTIFAKGIKFWNTDDFNLTTNNIEWSVINSV